MKNKQKFDWIDIDKELAEINKNMIKKYPDWPIGPKTHSHQIEFGKGFKIIIHPGIWDVGQDAPPSHYAASLYCNDVRITSIDDGMLSEFDDAKSNAEEVARRLINAMKQKKKSSATSASSAVKP